MHCPIIPGTGKTFRMKLFWTWKLFRMDQRSRIHYPHVCQMSPTLQTWNHPPSVALPVITRSWQFIPGWIPTPSIAPSTALEHRYRCIRHVLYLYCFIAVYLLFLPPLYADRCCDRCRCFPPCSTTASTIVPLLSSFQASNAPSPLPDTTYLSIFFYCTRHCCCYVITYSIA